MRAIERSKKRTKSAGHMKTHHTQNEDVENKLIKMGKVAARGASQRARKWETEISSNKPVTVPSLTRGSSPSRIVVPESSRRHNTTSTPRRKRYARRHLRHDSSEESFFDSMVQQEHPLPSPEVSSSGIGSSDISAHNSLSSDGHGRLDEGAYSAVRPFERILYLDPNLNGELERGYVNSNGKLVKAILNHKLTRNVISERYAMSLGLTIQYSRTGHENNSDLSSLDPDIEEIDFGTGDDTCSIIGITDFNWRDSLHSPDPTRSKSFPVWCLVTKYLPFDRQLVFGKCFSDKKMHYLRR